MVCKNCGADLKPGIKYCLNCGYYIDEEEEEDDDDDSKEESLSLDDIDLSTNTDGEESKLVFDDYDKGSSKTVSKKSKKKKMTMTDMLIYGVLILIIVISFTVMIVSIVNSNKKTTVNPQSTVTNVEDNVIKTKNYTIKFSGKLNYSQDGEVVYISDDKNYTFSYRNSLDDYERYSKDLTILENSLKKSGYNVINCEKREVNETEFIIYKFKFDSNVKYLYVTKVDMKYVTMGTIEEIDNGDWREALTVINKINGTIKITDSSDSDTEINNVLNNSTTDISYLIK